MIMTRCWITADKTFAKNRYKTTTNIHIYIHNDRKLRLETIWDIKQVKQVKNNHKEIQNYNTYTQEQTQRNYEQLQHDPKRHKMITKTQNE